MLERGRLVLEEAQSHPSRQELALGQEFAVGETVRARQLIGDLAGARLTRIKQHARHETALDPPGLAVTDHRMVGRNIEKNLRGLLGLLRLAVVARQRIADAEL